jgi:hypothetical protein
VPVQAHGRLVDTEQLREAAVGKALALQAAQFGRLDRLERATGKRLLGQHDVLDLGQEPGVDLRQLEELLLRVALAERLADVPDALGAGVRKFVLQILAIGLDLVETVHADFKTAQRLLEGFLERAPHRHDLTDRLHLRSEAVVGLREFLERKARNLGHDIVDRGLERRRGRTAGDVVLQLIEREADGELGCDLRDRESGRLRS